MADETVTKKKGDSAAIVYVETVNGYAGPNITLLASDLKAYTTAQSDAKFTVPLASATVAGKIKVGSGLTIDANGVLGTNSAAPDWSAITNKPTEFPPNKAGLTVVGGVKVGTGLSIAADGTLSATATAPDWSQITGKPAAYPPTIASATQVGGVKQGSGIFIDPVTGTINASGSLPTWDQILDKPVVFPPPIASNTVLGGVKEGTGVEIQSDGTISATPTWDEITGKPVEFPPVTASRTVRGGVYVGSGLQDDNNGVLSVSLADANNIGGVILGKTLATDAQSGRTDVVPASKDQLGAVRIGDTLFIDDQGDLQANPGAISPATDTTLGGVKIGEGVKVTEDGVISVPPFPMPTNRFITPTPKNNQDYHGTWKVPEGCKVFRVTVIGNGGSSGWSRDNKTGGSGGGGGGWIQQTYFGFEPGTEFSLFVCNYVLQNKTNPNNFGKDGKVILQAYHGGAGGGSGDANAIVMGGLGGYPEEVNGMSGHTPGPALSGIGGSGGMAYVLNGKKIGGAGGSSFFGGSTWALVNSGLSAGCGGPGGGDPQGFEYACAGANGFVMIEY